MKFGFEMEYFLRRHDTEEIVEIPAGLPKDECGYLVECRGPADSDPLRAAYLFLAEEDKLVTQAYNSGYVLDKMTNTIKLCPKFRREIMRRHGKEPYPSARYNLYGKDFPVNDKWDRAGLHVHFSNEREITTSTCAQCKSALTKTTVSGPLNMPLIIRTLDEKYKQEIKEAKRLLGWYELKPHGFEYRSLPAHFAGGVVGVAKVLKTLEGKMEG